MRNTAFQEDRERIVMKLKNHEEFSVQMMKELDKRRMMNFLQKEESKSTMNRLMVQILGLQDKVNSLNDAKKFHDSETASTSGLSLRSQSADEYSESKRID